MIIITLLILFIPSFVFSTPSRLVDGKIQFAVASVNNLLAWTNSEKSDFIDTFNNFQATSSVTIINYTPQNYEINLSTLTIYENHTDYLNCQTKSGLRLKLLKLKQELDLAIELNDSIRINEIKPKILWLKQYFSTLP